MRERVEAAGGLWGLRSSPGHGTEIIARIPSGAVRGAADLGWASAESPGVLVPGAVG
jgi:signal transduction histidine kinase